jgi:type IV secretory pathway TrbD component
LLGGFDRACVVFVGLIVAVVAHSVLNESLVNSGVRLIGISF